MNHSEEGTLLRIYVGENDTHHGRSVHVAIVEEARRMHLAGATVLRGTMGFGAGSRIHESRFLRLSEDLPVVIEIVDSEERLEALLPFLDEVVVDGLVTMERVRIVKHRHRAGGT